MRHQSITFELESTTRLFARFILIVLLGIPSIGVAQVDTWTQKAEMPMAINLFGWNLARFYPTVDGFDMNIEILSSLCSRPYSGHIVLYAGHLPMVSIPAKVGVTKATC
jgi:hypothetical protein